MDLRIESKPSGSIRTIVMYPEILGSVSDIHSSSNRKSDTSHISSEISPDEISPDEIHPLSHQNNPENLEHWENSSTPCISHQTSIEPIHQSINEEIILKLRQLVEPGPLLELIIRSYQERREGFSQQLINFVERQRNLDNNK